MKNGGLRECKWLVTKTPPLLKPKCAISFLRTLINFYGNYNVDPFISYTTDGFFTRIEWSNNCFDLIHKPFKALMEITLPSHLSTSRDRLVHHCRLQVHNGHFL